MRRDVALSLLGYVLISAVGWAAPCEQGAALFKARNFTAAQNTLWECVYAGTDDPMPGLYLAWTYRELKNYEDGLTLVNSALIEKKENEDIIYLAAYLHFRMGEQDESFTLLNRAFRLVPDDWRLHQLYAFNFLRAKMLESARTELDRAIRLNSSQAELYYDMGRLDFATERYQHAVGEYQKAVMLIPDYAEALDNLGLAYHAIGNDIAARDAFEKAMAVDMKNGIRDEWPYLNYGTVLMEHDPQEALSLLTRALEENPTSADANYEIARAQQMLGRDAEAIKSLEKSLRLNPSLPSACYMLAQLYRKTDPARSSLLMERFRRLKAAEAKARKSPL